MCRFINNFRKQTWLWSQGDLYRSKKKLTTIHPINSPMLAFKTENHPVHNRHYESDDQEMRDNVENEENLNSGGGVGGGRGNMFGKQQNQAQSTCKQSVDSLTIQNRNSIDVENVFKKKQT